MTQRELATVRKIKEIKTIDGADAIELAIVDGWQVVVKKGEFVEGQNAVYFEIDSWIPHTLAPLLSKGKEPKDYNGIKGERLRTVKLRGTLSQGLLLPVDILYNVNDQYGKYDYPVGLDVTDFLGVQKYEKPIPACLAGQVRGNFPSCIPKTDQERVQNIKEFVPGKYEVTEKLEGSSMTVGLLNGEFIVCSRNLNLKEDENNAFWKVARKNNIEDKLRSMGVDNIVLQGELVGPKIQNNIYNLKDYEFYVFDVYDIKKGGYLTHPERIYFVEGLKLNHVPVIFKALGVRKDIPENTPQEVTKEAIIKLADGVSWLNKNQLREGIVFKHTECPDISFKAISNKYLLKEK